LRKFAYPVLVKVLEERRTKIADNFAAAEADRQQAAALKADLEAEIRKMRSEAQAMMAHAVKSGEEAAQEIIAAAKAETERIKEDAKAEIEREKEKAVAELRNSVASLSIMVAEKIISRSLDDRVSRQLVDEFISEAGGLPC
jgi:F-type H+-transporting ATPase subunit b